MTDSAWQCSESAMAATISMAAVMQWHYYRHQQQHSWRCHPSKLVPSCSGQLI
jgi:hypothetical protein